MKITLAIILLCFTMTVSAQRSRKKKVIYKYKKYEKFDFENLNIEGDTSNPGDISISPRFEKRFKNALPEKPNFNNEIKNAVQAIR